MKSYVAEWIGIDRGHEGFWKRSVWAGVLQELNRCGGIADFSDNNAPFYKALQTRFPDIPWWSTESNGKLRCLFRDAREPWAGTGVIEFSDTFVKLSSLGKQFVDGKISYDEVITKSLITYTENSENPFKIISRFFLKCPIGNGLSFDDIVKLMRHYRDETDDFFEILSVPPEDISSTGKRRLKAILKLLSQVGAIFEDTDYYVASAAVLKKIALSSSKVRENLQQIFFGAPGTGKSHEIKEQTADQSVVRTTFHPDSDYSTFVGAYKPTTKEIPVTTVIGTKAVPVEDSQGNAVIESKIVYEFVEQAFLKAYVNAWTLLAENKPQFLIVEEINRGNCAQIFGDLFQLLDRNDFGFSDYPITADKDLQKHLEKAFENLNVSGADIEGEYEESNDSIAAKVKSGEVLLLPKNLYIWATMNTSDQSLFPIDSAFKRRWDWKYIPIDTKKENWSIKVNGSAYSWSDFLEKINEKIGSTTSSEDKKLGFYFCKANNTEISADRFVSKVLFYIYNDVFKDYGYEDSMFKNEGKVIPFQSFYNTDGSVNEAVVEILLKNLNVLKNSEVIAGDDEESEDSDSSGKDLTRYTINGEGSFPKRQVATEAIKKYIELNPGKTAAEVVADWKTLGNVVSHFVETQEEYDGRQDNSKRSNEVACGSEKFYVSHNGWEPNSIQRLMNAVNAKDWGITLAKAE